MKTPTAWSAARAAALGGVDAGGNADRHADQQRYEGQFKRRGIVLEDDARDRLLKAKRFAEIAVENARKIVAVLHGNRHVEAERMAKLLQVFCARAFAEHLLHRIAGNDVREQKNHRDDQPERGQREQQSHRKVADHFARRSRHGRGVASASESASARAAGGAAVRRMVEAMEPSDGPAARIGLIFTRETRRRSISITVKR